MRKTSKATENNVNYEVKVKRATECKSGDVAFDMIVNGVTIYGCFLTEGRNGNFVAFPSRKGNDGKYYNIAYFSVTEEMLAEIESQIESLLEK